LADYPPAQLYEDRLEAFVVVDADSRDRILTLSVNSRTLEEAPADRPPARRARALLAAGAVLTATGVALSGSVHPDVGSLALLIGWLALGVGIHRVGRLGV
jgi:hypothetical protein